MYDIKTIAEKYMPGMIVLTTNGDPVIGQIISCAIDSCLFQDSNGIVKTVLLRDIQFIETRY